MKKKWQKSPQTLIDLFYEVMTFFPEADLRKMFGYPCAFLNGNMFVGLHESNMIVRLSSADRQRVLESSQGAVFAPMEGKVMREYIAVSQEIIQEKGALKELLDQSFQYMQSLPPKVKKSG